ncbi:sulfate ABC transporter permease subunit CysT [Pararhodospirillum oryzae]|uniref:sulfate ABC transporter permease subunit CysT n=1 Tax=Pararhodospirillum oryzae TaxID=478448 RepID=UPI003898F959
MSSRPLARLWPRRRPSVLPGFGLTLGFAVFYLGLLVLLPLAAVFLRAAGLTPEAFWALVTHPRTIAALRVSFGASLVAAFINVGFGALTAWVLVRYRFPGRRLLDAVVDLPFALPTAVAGIALSSLYAVNGPLGGLLAPLGIKVAYTWLGVVVALTFIGLPFVVRTVQPVLEDLDKGQEEAAATLGASRWQTLRRVVLPALAPALLTGFTLAFARAVGEYGSVIFIAGNLPYRTEIAPLLIVIQLGEYNYAGATALAVVMLVIAFVLLLAINLLQAWSRRRLGGV